MRVMDGYGLQILNGMGSAYDDNRATQDFEDAEVVEHSSVKTPKYDAVFKTSEREEIDDMEDSPSVIKLVASQKRAYADGDVQYCHADWSKDAASKDKVNVKDEKTGEQPEGWLSRMKEKKWVWLAVGVIAGVVIAKATEKKNR